MDEEKKERLEGFKGRMKIFIWFLMTEPGRQLKDFVLSVKNMLVAFNKTMTWIYLFLILTFYNIWEGEKIIAIIIFTLLILTILIWEWESGNHIYQYRKYIRKKKEEENDRLQRNN